MTRGRLAPWRERYEALLGSTVTSFGLDIAEKCRIACQYIKSSDILDVVDPFPPEAIITKTRVGSPGRCRPPTARAAEYATYILKQRIGIPSEAAHEYLEMLLDTLLTSKEVSHRLRRRRKEVQQRASNITNAYVSRLTMQKVREDYREALLFVEREKDMPSIMKARILRSVSSRLTLFPLIRDGRFNHLDPIVEIIGRRRLSAYDFKGINFSVSEAKLSFDILKGIQENVIEWAMIVAVPRWYFAWIGQESLPILMKQQRAAAF